MSATPADAEDQNLRATGGGLSPERRLDAIADILVRGLARLLLSEDAAAGRDDAHVAQVAVNTPERALLNGPRDALMVKGGRTQ